MENYRIKRLQQVLKNPILIKKKENLFYLTGRSFDLRAEEYLLVTKKEVVAFGSGLENIGWVKKSDRLKNIGQYLKAAKQLNIEWGFSYGEGEYLKFKISNSKLKIRVKPERSPVDEMRQVKEQDELSKIRKSMQIVEKVFTLVRKEISRGARSRFAGKKKGMAEYRLAQFIQNSGLKMGAEDLSFPAIVASGANAAIPHHVPSSRKLKAGESIIIDFGFKYKNYCSDFTRTVFLKKVPKNLEMAYNQTEKAYSGSMDFINERLSLIGGVARIGKRYAASGSQDASRASIRVAQPYTVNRITGNDVYQRSVDILAEKKLDKYFIHSLGHGTGLEIHELPNLSPKSKDELKDNMVFSIEPGVYLPKEGGIRIEDLVYLENGKVRKFINASTKLVDNVL